jgi:hypothetical protein
LTFAAFLALVVFQYLEADSYGLTIMDVLK